MLTKMFLEYIVRPAELEEFEASLEQHQRATGASGDSILQRAVRDHNVGACGKVSLSDRTVTLLTIRCTTTLDWRLLEPYSGWTQKQPRRPPASESMSLGFHAVS
jgi:hypothetical protein